MSAFDLLHLWNTTLFNIALTHSNKAAAAELVRRLSDWIGRDFEMEGKSDFWGAALYVHGGRAGTLANVCQEARAPTRI